MAIATAGLKWTARGGLGTLVARIDGDRDRLVIDHDPARGECSWFLTWFHADRHPNGLVLQSDTEAHYLKDYATTWMGDDE